MEPPSTDEVFAAVSLGVNKINIDTDIRRAFTDGIKDYIKKDPDNIDPRKMFAPAKEDMKKLLKRKCGFSAVPGKLKAVNILQKASYFDGL